MSKKKNKHYKQSHSSKLRSNAKKFFGQYENNVTRAAYIKNYDKFIKFCREQYDCKTKEECAELQARIDFLIAQKISSDNVYKYLLYFDKLYDKFTDKEKKTFLGSFVEKIEIYPTETPNGRILKRIQFRFPLFYDGEEIIGLSWDNETTLEMVVQLSRY